MKIKPIAKLHGSLEHRLAMYAMAASAAGAGLLSFSQPASAKVVYTKRHKHLLANVPLPLDLNRDGITDFSLFFVQNSYGYRALYAEAEPTNQIAGYCGQLSQGCWASALLPAVRVGPNQRFGAYRFMAIAGGCTRSSSSSKSYCRSFGPWGNVQKRYMGFEFFVRGKPHYGWARLNVDLNHSEVILSGYAYETVPNKPLVTGKTKGPDVITLGPGTLGRLARGVTANPKSPR